MSDAKTIRKQIRNVAQELLPEALSNEVIQSIEASLRKQISAELEALKENVAATLQRMDERSKDVQTFILNNVQADLAARNQAAAINPTQNTEASTTLNPTEGA